MSKKPSSLNKPKAKPPQVPGYVVREEVGRGAMGIVYRATQKIVDREVAIKVLHPEHSNTPRLVSRLRREARTTARLAHPHVVSAIDMGETDGLWWYAMEYVDGVSLSERLKKDGKLSERTALRLLIPLCEALEHLYENGVVHRDIKPGNILISKVGGARLADLGLAFAEDDPSLTGRGGTLGTPHYISPEQAVDARRADVRSDIWSFGATLFHAVCGQPPFTGKSTAEILSAVLYAPIPEPRELSPDLSKGLSLILRKCLTRDVDLRYQTPGELLRDLERVRERRPPKIRSRQLDPVAGDEGSRKWLLLAAAALVGVLGAGWWADAFGVRSRSAGVDAGSIAPFRPLEDLAKRLPPAPAEVTDCLRELEALRGLMDPQHRPRWEEVNTNLIVWLGGRQHSAQVWAEQRVADALGTLDFKGAHATLEASYADKLEVLSGLNRHQLGALGLASGAWYSALENRILEQEGLVSARFEDQLAAWTSELRLGSDRLIDEGRWREAEALMSRDLASVMRELSSTPLGLPSKTMLQFDQLLQTGLALSLSALKDRWRAMDKGIAQRIRERCDQLLEELEQPRRPRPYTSLEFERDFSEELGALEQELEFLPRSFTLTSQGLYRQRMAKLSARETELLAADARAEIQATGALVDPLWRQRNYARVAELWGEVEALMVQLHERTRDGDDGWRRNLESDCSLRRAEALLVQREVLQRAADRVVALNGLRLEKLTVGGITLSRQKVKSGLFPLIDGFRVVDFAEPIFLQELSSNQLLMIAELEQPEQLRGAKRMALASFFFHEERYVDAAQLLRQEVPLLDDLEGLYWDLERRVASASGINREDRDARERDAQYKLDYVFNSANQLHMASKVKLYVNSLLGELGDLELVRSKSKRLREVRSQLRHQSSLSPKDGIRLAYRLDAQHLLFSGAKDVSLEYVFDSKSVGTWQKGQWIFDAAGWSNREKAQSWDELIYQNGPRLNLVKPLLTERFELTLELESIDGGQIQLLALSAMGFNVALFGPGLPGNQAGYGIVVKSGRFDDFLAGLSAAKRVSRKELLLPKQKHVLRLSGHRLTGALKIELDGRSIWSGNHNVARGESPSIQLVAWDRMRLSHALLKASR